MASGKINWKNPQQINITATASVGVVDRVECLIDRNIYHLTVECHNTNDVSEGSNIATIVLSRNFGNAQTCTFNGARIAIGQLTTSTINVRQSKGTYTKNSQVLLWFQGLREY